MKTMRKPALLAVILLLVLALLCSCAKKDDTVAPIPTVEAMQSAETTGPPTGAADLNNAAGTAVLANVNGYPVRQAEADQIASNLMNVYAAYGYDVSSGENAVMIRNIALNYAMEMAVLDAKADEWGIKGPEGDELTELTAEQHTEWENMVKSYAESLFGVTEKSSAREIAAAREQAESILAIAGYTEQSMLDAAIRETRREKVQAEMVKDVRVDDEEIQAAYDAQAQAEEAACREDQAAYINLYEMTRVYTGKSPIYVPEGYRGVLQILLSVDNKLLSDYQNLSAQMEEQVEKQLEGGEAAASGEQVTQEQVDAARDAIVASVQSTYDEIAAKLAAGTPFLDLVDQYNIDPGMKNEKNRAEGYSVHLDSTVYDPAFISAAFSMSHIGEISGPVVGSYGVYVVYYLRDIPAGPSGLTDQLKSELTEKLLGEKEDAIINGNMEQWVSEAKVEMTQAGTAWLIGQ